MIDLWAFVYFALSDNIHWYQNIFFSQRNASSSSASGFVNQPLIGQWLVQRGTQDFPWWKLWPGKLVIKVTCQMVCLDRSHFNINFSRLFINWLLSLTHRHLEIERLSQLPSTGEVWILPPSNSLKESSLESLHSPLGPLEVLKGHFSCLPEPLWSYRSEVALQGTEKHQKMFFPSVHIGSHLWYQQYWCLRKACDWWWE